MSFRTGSTTSAARRTRRRWDMAEGRRVSTLRWLAAKHSHTTHVLSTAKIHYPYHPHYGQTVTMVRKCSHLGPHQVQVALPSGGQLLVPEWMMDEDLCRGMEIVERPVLSIVALLSLRDLIDAQQSPPKPSGTIASKVSSPGGVSDEPTSPGSSSLGDSPHTRAATGHTTALP